MLKHLIAVCDSVSLVEVAVDPKVGVEVICPEKVIP